MQFPGEVLILEADPARRVALETILNFLGLKTQAGDVTDCLSYFDSNPTAVTVGILGSGPLPAEALLRDHPDTAFIAAGPGIVGARGQEAVNFMGCLDANPDYDRIVTLLHFCQSYISMRRLTDKSGTGAARLIKMLVGQGPAITAVRRLIEQVAQTEANVLILGESGTGKEVVARAVHELSPRGRKPFVPVNCGAIPGELLESELFGHEKGAFTGAFTSREGRFEMAAGGTLFLDEIGDMPLPMQVKLLRVLQERTFSRVGSNKQLTADVRIVAATHQNLEQMVADGSFREDLYYRLNVFPIETPPLRARPDDIPLLTQELVNRHSSRSRTTVRFTQAAMLQLMQNEWKGNVRELSNLVERLLILHPNEIVDLGDLPPKYRGAAPQDDPAAERSALLDKFSAPDETEDESEDDPENAVRGLEGADDNRPIRLPPLPIIEGEQDMARAFAPTLEPHGIVLKDMIAKIEINMIRQALQQSGGTVAKAAEILGLRRTTLVEKMKKYGINGDSEHPRPV